MDAFVSDLLLPGAARGAVALALVALAGLAAHRSSATLRHRLWVLGLGAALVLPVLGPLTPQVALLPIPMAEARAAAPAVARSAPAPTATAPASAVAPVPAAPGAAQPAPIPSRSAVTPSAALLGLWFLGTAAILTTRGLGLGARRRLRRSAEPLTDSAWRDLAGELAAELGVVRRVTLLSSPTATVPMTWGTLRPVILLPAAALAWPQDRRRAVLLHELAHVRRNDAAVNGLAHLACAAHWPNPLVWLAARGLRAEAEHAADDRVLARGERPSLYAGHLLAVARAMALGNAPPQPVLAMASREGSSSLARRIGAILDGDRSRTVGRPWVRRATVGAAAAATLALAAIGCVRVDGLQYSLSSDSSDAKTARGYFAQERFVGQCTPGLMSGSRQSIHVRGSRSGRQEINLRFQSCKLEIELDGKVRLDEQEILELGSGATFSLDETSGAGQRSLSATAGAAGAPVFRYLVDQVERPVDDEARAFLARAILEIHRSTTVGAEDRVARILAAGGTTAVLAEVEQISTDFLRATYLKQLLEQAHPRGTELGAVLAATATLIDSDYERGQILQAVAANAETGVPLPAEFFRATESIESDYERSQALKKALARPQVTEEELTQVLASARGLESDYERSQVLRSALERSALPEPTALEVVRSIEGIESDYEASQVLVTLIGKRSLSTAEIAAVIAATDRLDSDYERSQVLVALAQANRLDGPTLDLYVAAAEAMDGEYERNRALAAALRARKG